MSLSETVWEMTREYISKDGLVTCEFAGSAESLAYGAKALQEASQRLGIHYGARWVVLECETCEEYHGEAHKFHVAIERFSDCPSTHPNFVFDYYRMSS